MSADLDVDFDVDLRVSNRVSMAEQAIHGSTEGQWLRGPGMDVFPPRLGGGQA